MIADMRYIRRRRTGPSGPFAWEVRIQRGANPQSKLFSDSVWGGEQAALAAARAWRDERVHTQLRRLHHIYREIDTEGPRAWRVVCKRDGITSSKGFSDRVWGGGDLSLAAALWWRNEQLGIAHEPGAEVPVPRNPPPQAAKAPAAQKQARHAREATVPKKPAPLSRQAAHISRYEIPAHADGRRGPSAFWVASWVDAHGIALQRKFSVSFWGEEVAKSKALALVEPYLPRMAAPEPTEPPQERKPQRSKSATRLIRADLVWDL